MIVGKISAVLFLFLSTLVVKNTSHYHYHDHETETETEEKVYLGLIIAINIFLSTFLCCCCCGCFGLCFCDFCCGCCCGQCGDPPIKCKDLFKEKSRTSSKNAKTYIDKGYEEMTKADTFLKMSKQHTLAKLHLEGANKNFETALNLLLEQNKLYNSQSHAIQLNENNELIGIVERNIEENVQKIKSLNNNCANISLNETNNVVEGNKESKDINAI